MQGKQIVASTKQILNWIESATGAVCRGRPQTGESLSASVDLRCCPALREDAQGARRSEQRSLEATADRTSEALGTRKTTDDATKSVWMFDRASDKD